MDENECVAGALGNEGGGDDGFTEGGRGGQHAVTMWR
jgi:hypothetical protein